MAPKRAPKDSQGTTGLPPLSLFKHVFCMCTLGLLCGWYYFLLFLFPFLLIGAFTTSIPYVQIVSISIVSFLVILSIIPIKHEPWTYFMYSWIFRWWREYFDYTVDCSTIHNKLPPEEKFIFFEFVHGVFPMGQFLSASLIDDIAPGQMICGTGADVIFSFPVMRQIMSWLGTHRASSSSISRILKKWGRAAIIPGGIAEMYCCNSEKETCFFTTRKNTVKVAIQNGANIVPTFFFGNTKIFTVVGEGAGTDSTISKLSRKMRASILLFFGRFFLPVPYRHKLKMTTGNIIRVKQNDNPSDKEVEDVMKEVIKEIKVLWERRPEWETRPLEII